ncbi:MAG: hypothetical protein M0Q22_02655 [Sulfuritalea sp.]|jgi:hypothetical protein|nr:hypothetical protein [Sulfuritalea sp.]
MPDLRQNIVFILDDREFAGDEVRTVVGARRFGDIIFKRHTLVERFRSNLPDWARSSLVHLRTADELPALRAKLESSGEDGAAFVIAGRAGFSEPDRLHQLVERLPYAEDDFTDRLYQPLVLFLRNAHRLVECWRDFEEAPVHTWERAWQNTLRVQSVQPLDLGKLRDFLSFTCGATETRHFNQVHVDTYYYTKQSSNKAKMLEEYVFYGLVPEQMRPWLIEPFEYVDHGDSASYRMLRYYLADAALQWVHGAFDAESFAVFVDRLLFFIAQRPRKSCDGQQAAGVARELFVEKVQSRAIQFLALDEGKRINALAASISPALELNRQIERYLRIYHCREQEFSCDHLVVGHGDPCFSNVLYDQRSYMLKLIDPKGAATEAAMWTHPLYDLCKVSHSVLGDYDFINNGLYSVSFADNIDLELRLEHSNPRALKAIFSQRIRAQGYDETLVRLGEASLFLSMLPLHIDYPNKVIAFMLKARHILDEVERMQGGA